MTSQILSEYLRIRSIPQLRAIVDKFEEGRDGSLPFQGEWVHRIDFLIAEPLTSPDLIPRLLRRTPNLIIYVNRMGGDFRPEAQTPSAVLEALAKYCGSSLRRIEWSGEAPTYYDLANLSPQAPSLETISLGLIPHPIDTVVELPRTWDPLLARLAEHPEALPALRRVEVDVFPMDLGFFHAHGAKIRVFRTMNWSTPPMLPSALPLMPNLDSLILTQSTEYVTLPPAHPALRRICVAPFMGEHIVVPPRFFASAVLTPLDSVLLSIDSTKLPCLEEVRLRNIGILDNLVHEPAWLLKWARRWHFRGVRFCDMRGRSFGEVEDPNNDPLLDLVRG
ncbi:hypothetical protein B0H17DRAFT_1205391 [Mycena rosella]|uniref:Uncharacterized protein n=1 Tax=Mycena rosella TaxID=1033263 RepID=A0AAD7DAM5_MYCRO|nr:hypothetical protein B0H17DRAFT_1205391 [Mycena rosella]